MLFGDADIDKLSARSLSALRRPVPNAGRSCRDGADGRVLLHPLQQMRGRQFVVGFGGRGVEQFAGDLVEGCTPVPALLVLLGRCIALALQCIDVYHDGVVRVLYFLEGVDERPDVVALINIEVVQPHGAEQVVAALSVREPEFLKVVVESAVVLGDRHLVVVHDDDEVRAEFGRPVQALQRLAAAERTVADDGDDIAVLTLQVAPLGQAASQTHRRGGVTDDEVVVRALGRLTVARHVIVVVGVDKCSGAARQHLVRIALVRHVKDNLVLGRREHIVHGDGGLDHAQVGTAVAAMVAYFLDEERAYLGGECSHFL